MQQLADFVCQVVVPGPTLPVRPCLRDLAVAARYLLPGCTCRPWGIRQTERCFIFILPDFTRNPRDWFCAANQLLKFSPKSLRQGHGRGRGPALAESWMGRGCHGCPLAPFDLRHNEDDHRMKIWGKLEDSICWPVLIEKITIGILSHSNIGKSASFYCNAHF